MESKISIRHKNGQAFYTITHERDGLIRAHLFRYTGSTNHLPPDCLFLQKRGLRWKGNEPDQRLVDKIGTAIEQQAKRPAYVYKPY